MKELNASQLKALSDFFINSAVAWFTAGVVSPFFLRPKTVLDFITSFCWGIVMALAFIRYSLSLLGEVK